MVPTTRLVGTTPAIRRASVRPDGVRMMMATGASPISSSVHVRRLIQLDSAPRHFTARGAAVRAPSSSARFGRYQELNEAQCRMQAW